MIMQRKLSSAHHSRGFGLMEIIITVSLVAAALIMLGQVVNAAMRVLSANKSTLEASYLTAEGLEGVRALRDAGWSANIGPLVNGTTYYLVATSSFGLTTSPQSYINGRYLRQILFYAVNRDGSDKIASSGTLDSGTKKVKVTVSWSGKNGTSSVDTTAYVTNFLQN